MPSKKSQILALILCMFISTINSKEYLNIWKWKSLLLVFWMIRILNCKSQNTELWTIERIWNCHITGFPLYSWGLNTREICNPPIYVYSFAICGFPLFSWQLKVKKPRITKPRIINIVFCIENNMLFLKCLYLICWWYSSAEKKL